MQMRFVGGSPHAFVWFADARSGFVVGVEEYRFIEEALVEYEDAIEYYERIQDGLGIIFVREVEESLALALEFPEMGTLVAEPGVRRRILHRFGVELVYLVRANVLIVLAVFHGKRRPGYWRERLEHFR